MALRVLAMLMDAQPLHIRQPVVTLLCVTRGLWWMTMSRLRMQSPFETLSQESKTTEQVHKTTRVYIYSEMNDMGPWLDIQDDAAKVRRLGFNVELEKY